MKKELKAICDDFKDVVAIAKIKKAGEWVFLPVSFGDIDIDGEIPENAEICVNYKNKWIFDGFEFKTLREAFRAYAYTVESTRRATWATKEKFEIEIE